MARGKLKETKIVIMSPDLMKVYDLQGMEDLGGHFPITFCDPQECLEMMVDSELDDDEILDREAEDRTERIERQWGELELRLSFFSDAFNWQ